ncbi:hypothetical protein GQ53DRAFT_215488 [Thozetella sp. PMI_491]|nr:hypothetical protein GQ53DRAFT_215488 [Thozetella sp. PMI_491]
MKADTLGAAGADHLGPTVSGPLTSQMALPLTTMLGVLPLPSRACLPVWASLTLRPSIIHPSLPPQPPIERRLFLRMCPGSRASTDGDPGCVTRPRTLASLGKGRAWRGTLTFTCRREVEGEREPVRHRPGILPVVPETTQPKWWGLTCAWPTSLEHDSPILSARPTRERDQAQWLPSAPSAYGHVFQARLSWRICRRSAGKRALALPQRSSETSTARRGLPCCSCRVIIPLRTIPLPYTAVG